jgi:hypothetical protein
LLAVSCIAWLDRWRGIVVERVTLRPRQTTLCFGEVLPRDFDVVVCLQPRSYSGTLLFFRLGDATLFERCIVKSLGVLHLLGCTCDNTLKGCGPISGRHHTI